MEDVQSRDSAHGHPLLQGRRRSAPYTHGFSKPLIKSLAALCDTFIPAISPEQNDPEAESFYLLSGSENEVPDQVAETMSSRVKPIGLKLGKVILWLLSTRVGTWLLCGSPSLKPRFPYLQFFSEISLAKREQILLNWSRGKKSALLRFAFQLFKICCLFTFYSVADEKGENPAWKAIGYCPPKLSANHLPKPLDKGVIDPTSSGEDLASLFKGTGFTVTEEKDSTGKITINWQVSCDVVVVGSGSGGSVAAGVLARAGYKVLVLEKGKYFARDDLTLLEGPSLEKMYESGGLLSTNDGKIIIMAGATVGGGSAINWSASIRTPQNVLEEWAKNHDLPFFATQEYQNAMDAVCARLGVQDRCEKESFQNTVLRKGCEKLGFKVENVPRNSNSDHFCGSCCFGCPAGNKKSTDETWLVDAVNAGAIILAGCKAEKVICVPNNGKKQKNRAAGVIATIEGVKGRVFIQARVTVAAAGSVLTPPLLRSSGLKNCNIGRNLRLHPVQMAWGYFPKDREPVGNPYEGGIITAICKDQADTINQTPALAPGSFAAMMPWTSGLDMKKRMRNYSRTAHIFALLRDKGSGSVMDYKDIDYRIEKAEKERLREGLRRAVRILVAAGASEVGTHRSDGQRIVADGATEDEMEGFFSDVDLAKRGRSLWTTTCSAHQMGSCRMGRDEKAGAVDWKGQTWEVEGLFVCDGSLLPTAVGVNPMITIQSVAYYVSQHILRFLSIPSS